jgi:hypothetical protein
MAFCLRAGVMILLGTLTGSVSAQQTSFYRNDAALHYGWHLPDSAPQSFLINLPRQSQLPPWQEWRADQANAVIYQNLLRDAHEQFPDVTFRYHRGKGYLGQSSVDFESTDPDQLNAVSQWLNTQQNALLQAYMEQHYYKLIGSDMLRPDHIRIAQEAARELQPTASQLRARILPATAQSTTLMQMTEEQQVIAGLLDFVQSIPYDALTMNQGMRGNDFLMPVQVLRENRGDCDSKATLLMALLHALYPDLPQAMIYVPEHAMLAVGIAPFLPDQYSVTLQGQSYLILETSGPAELPPGAVGDESRMYLDARQYQFDELQ